jgi:predicted ATPase/DNA-binding CsgD family transcriptional regulator
VITTESSDPWPPRTWQNPGVSTRVGEALTAKESEVLTLVEQRLTNAEIAHQLYISVRTVESHVSALLRKHGVTSRRELATLRHPAAARLTSTHVVPPLRTPLIGREKEVAAIVKRARTDRLTTLIGPGGVGKTSIAVAVAHAHSDAGEWSDGVVFVDLVPAHDLGDVLRAVADALGVDGAVSNSGTELGRHLADLSVLIVLDNCEHVVDSVARFVHAAFGQGGSWHVLGTSREPLGLTGEHLVPIEPLDEAAAALFVERARQSEPRVAWDATDPRIASLCARLDGLPLAIELAAGQLRRWSLDEITRRLTDSGQGGLPPRAARGEPRHRSMDTAIGWSYGLLDESERRVLRHLGVFPSAFGLVAAESLQPLLGDLDVSATLGALVDKSLVAHAPDDDEYRLLETVKAFAIERLVEHGEREATFEHHRRWTVQRATSTTRADRWFSARLAAEQHAYADHVRQAFWSSVGAGRYGDAVDLAATRSFLWRNAVGCAEGRRWLDALVDEPVDDADSAWVSLLRSDIAQGDGDFVAMITSAEETVELGPEADGDAYALALHFAALVDLLDLARVDEALARVRVAASSERMVALVDAFFLVAHAGRLSTAEFELRSLELHRKCSSDGYERFIFNWAVWMHGLALRDESLARSGIDQQYEFLDHTGLGETWLTAYSMAVTRMIDGGAGREHLAHALGLAGREGYRIEGDCVLALAYSEVCCEHPVEAAELLGLARTCRFNATAHHVLHGVVVEPLVRRGLDLADYSAALERGKQRSVDATFVEYAIR